MKKIRLSLGPVLYYWSRKTLIDFYKKVADAPIDIVYLGETVCSKRRSFNRQDWLDIAEILTKTGKSVVLSSLSLVESAGELSALRALSQQQYLFEANDFSAIQNAKGNAFVAGYTINIYNQHSLQYLVELGLRRWVMPLELSQQTLHDILQYSPAGLETEIFAYGRLPLASSARCFTARAHNLPKDNCQLKCLDDPDGLLLKTTEEQDLFILNGIQTQSAQTFSLLSEIPQLKDLGIDILRISPQAENTFQVIELFNQALQDQQEIISLNQQLEALMPIGACNGYWHQKAGIL